MKAFLMALGFSLICASYQYSPAEITGDWRTIFMAADDVEKISERGVQRIYFRHFECRDECHEMVIDLYSKSSGECQKFSVVATKSPDDVYEADSHGVLGHGELFKTALNDSKIPSKLAFLVSDRSCNQDLGFGDTTCHPLISKQFQGRGLFIILRWGHGIIGLSLQHSYPILTDEMKYEGQNFFQIEYLSDGVIAFYDRNVDGDGQITHITTLVAKEDSVSEQQQKKFEELTVAKNIPKENIRNLIETDDCPAA